MAKHVTFWAAAFSILALDRLSKLLILKYLPLNSSIDFGILSITHVLNTGTAFGMLKNASWFFIVFAAAVSAFLIVRYQKFPSPMHWMLGLILGGAVGNLIDRILYGAVVDFIDLHWWPVFNIADSAIVIAIVCLLFKEYMPKRKI